MRARAAAYVARHAACGPARLRDGATGITHTMGLLDMLAEDDTDDGDGDKKKSAPACERPGCEGLLDAEAEFCLACGHSAETANGQAAPAINEGMVSTEICPSCGATHMVDQGGGFPQCESCGYIERH